MSRGAPRSPAPWLGVSLLVLAGVAYLPVLGNGFVWDDEQYVLANRQVAGGLTPGNVRWAFTSFSCANWHPLTWISHQLDVQLFGLDPARHHLTNLFLHLAATWLLFLALRGLTGATGRSALAAGLFATHPLHVESVAWVAERKDVLSALLGTLTLLAYLRSVRSPGRGRRALVALALAAGLMAKPMLVTLPFVLLLLDYWPLSRVHGARKSPTARAALAGLFREKIPLFALAAASSAVTYVAQERGGAMQMLEHLSLPARAANAMVSYLAYLGQAAWPIHLAAFYPYPTRGVPVAAAMAAALALAAVTAGVVGLRRRQPWLTLGWFWFVGMLVPVIGLVPVGGQAMADRYTYLPLIGPFVAVAWGLRGLWPRNRSAGRAIAALAALLVSAAMTSSQVRHWRNEFELYAAALAVAPDNYIAHNNLARFLNTQGRHREAIGHLEQALRIKPSFAEAHLNLGLALEQAGRARDALGHFLLALRAKPVFPQAHVAAALALAALGRPEEALGQFGEALRDDPEFAEAHLNLANFLEEGGHFEEALRHYAEARRLDPGNEIVYYDLGVSLEKRGRRPEAAEQYRQALRLRPDFAEARERLTFIGARSVGGVPAPGGPAAATRQAIVPGSREP